ncbi:EAL domain-containing protein [Neobacillus sp. NPDC093182]|uniref:EAL domain-containing protein n=1 Tax=Neobacillus sp. NPDC093182 TaxID=3364297 RepID=UPI0038113DC8
MRHICCQSDNVGITSAMIKMRQILLMEVVAEGIETLEELEFLRENQCHKVQGFLFGGLYTFKEVERDFEKFRE